MRESKQNNQSKRFLSDSTEEYGSICWHVDTSTRIYDERYYRSAELRISDCSKHVYLSFDFTSDKQYEERLDKLDCLISELLLFRKALEESYELKPTDEEVQEYVLNKQTKEGTELLI